MTETITLRVLTREGIVLEDKALSVVAPGKPGYLGVLRNHAPLVTTLKPGKLTWREPTNTLRTAWVGDGLMEIARNQLTLLVTEFHEDSAKPTPSA